MKFVTLHLSSTGSRVQVYYLSKLVCTKVDLERM